MNLTSHSYKNMNTPKKNAHYYNTNKFFVNKNRFYYKILLKSMPEHKKYGADKA